MNSKNENLKACSSQPNDRSCDACLEDNITLNDNDLFTPDKLDCSTFDSSQALSDTSSISFDCPLSDSEIDALIHESGLNFDDLTCDIGEKDNEDRESPRPVLLIEDEAISAVADNAQLGNGIKPESVGDQPSSRGFLSLEDAKSYIAGGRTVLVAVESPHQNLSLNTVNGVIEVASQPYSAQQGLVAGPSGIQTNPEDGKKEANPNPKSNLRCLIKPLGYEGLIIKFIFGGIKFLKS